MQLRDAFAEYLAMGEAGFQCLFSGTGKLPELAQEAGFWVVWDRDGVPFVRRAGC